MNEKLMYHFNEKQDIANPGMMNCHEQQITSKRLFSESLEPSQLDASYSLLTPPNSIFSQYSHTNALNNYFFDTSIFSVPVKHPMFYHPLNRPPGSGPVSNLPNDSKGSKPLICPICGYSYQHRFFFNSHMNTHRSSKCNECNYTCRTEGRLKMHIETFHSNKEKQEVTLRTNLSNAISPKTTKLPPLDQFWNISSLEKDSGSEMSEKTIRKYIRQTRNDKKPWRKICKECGYASRSKDEYWTHSRIHIEPKDMLSCEQCNFVTKHSQHMEYHSRNHEGLKPFQCTECKYCCNSRGMLNSHMKSHQDYYYFTCADCAYATNYPTAMKTHKVKYNHRFISKEKPSSHQMKLPPYRLPLFFNLTTGEVELPKSVLLDEEKSDAHLKYIYELVLMNQQKTMNCFKSEELQQNSVVQELSNIASNPFVATEETGKNDEDLDKSNRHRKVKPINSLALLADDVNPKINTSGQNLQNEKICNLERISQRLQEKSANT